MNRFVITAESDLLNTEIVYGYTIELVIVPCKVDTMNSYGQIFDDITIAWKGALELPFRLFEQEP